MAAQGENRAAMVGRPPISWEGNVQIPPRRHLDCIAIALGGFHADLDVVRIDQRVDQPDALHLIHRSVDPRHPDKNFACTFTIWDRLAGTLYVPDDAEKDTLVLGLGDGEERDFKTVWQLYATPFRNILGRLAARKSAAMNGVPAE